MAEAQLRQFLEKVRQLNAFVALSEADPQLRQELCDCEHHDQVVALARRCGFEIGRRWGEAPAAVPGAEAGGVTGVGNRVAGRSAGALATGIGVQPDHSDPSAEPRAATPADTAVLSAAIRQASEASQDRGGLSQSIRPGAARHGDAVSSMSSPSVEPGEGTLRSLLSGPCPPPGEEWSDVLIETAQWRLERIHSCSSRSPDGFWYEQQEDEWVLLLQGTARLRCADQPNDLELEAGDSLWLRAGRRHRVTATDPAPGTIWLALFWRTA